MVLRGKIRVKNLLKCVCYRSKVMTENPPFANIEHECLQFAQIITILSHQHTTVDLIENNDVLF